MNSALPEMQWQAVLSRDARADGRFYFAVVTTGVYCRPSCGARRPRRENVRFYPDRETAERAGFRPCRRCRPEQTDAAPHREAVLRACRRLEAAEAPPRLGVLAREAGLSPAQFQRVFRRMVGVTPKEYAAGRRAAALRQALPRAASVTEAVYAAGFGASSRFYAAAERELGMAPGRFRRGGEGETIRVAVTRCRLGQLLIAATERGVCAIELGDEAAALRRGLRERLPRARFAEADPELRGWAAEAVKLAEGGGAAEALPLDLRGTAFQLRVWRALREIPRGGTASYGEIARRLGAPRGARAVARACAANPVALAVPCHRVVRAGAAGGYRWGAERKRALLAREAAGGGA